MMLFALFIPAVRWVIGAIVPRSETSGQKRAVVVALAAALGAVEGADVETGVMAAGNAAAVQYAAYKLLWQHAETFAGRNRPQHVESPDVYTEGD